MAIAAIAKFMSLIATPIIWNCISRMRLPMRILLGTQHTVSCKKAPMLHLLLAHKRMYFTDQHPAFLQDIRLFVGEKVSTYP